MANRPSRARGRRRALAVPIASRVQASLRVPAARRALACRSESRSNATSPLTVGSVRLARTRAHPRDIDLACKHETEPRIATDKRPHDNESRFRRRKICESVDRRSTREILSTPERSGRESPRRDCWKRSTF